MIPRDKPFQLHVVHDLGGGVERWLNDFVAADDQRCNLVLRPFYFDDHYGAGLMLFLGAGRDQPLGFWPFSAPIEIVAAGHEEYRQTLAKILDAFPLAGIIVSSLIGHSLDALDTGLPTVFIGHDYFPVCPAINAHFNGPCSRCDDARLRECNQSNGGDFNPFRNFATESRIEVRQRFLSLVAGRGITLVAPTAAARAVWTGLAPALAAGRFDVIGHGVEPMVPVVVPDTVPTARLRVLVLGMQTPPKGFQLLESIAADIAEFADLLLLGAGNLGGLLGDVPGVEVVPSYAPAELPALVARLRPDVALLPAVWAETFSYVLSELNGLGVPVLASRLGAYAERIVDGETGLLFEPNATELLAALRALSRDRSRLPAIRQRAAALEPRAVSAMVADYHALLPAIERGTPRIERLGSAAEWSALHASAIAGLGQRARWLDHAGQIKDVVAGRQAARLHDARRRIGDLEYAVGERDGRLAALDQQLTATMQALTAAGQELAERQNSLEEARRQLAAAQDQVLLRDGQLAEQHRVLVDVRHQLDAMHASTSWRVTRPLRLIARLLRGEFAEIGIGVRYHAVATGRSLYWRIPVRYRATAVDLAFRLGGERLFKGLNSFERWRSRHGGPSLDPAAADMIDVAQAEPLAVPPGQSIAIHLHLFYPDLAPEFAAAFANMPFAYDLFVSTADEAGRQACMAALSGLPNQRAIEVVVVANRGRDMAPMLCTFGERLRQYDIIAHVHGKKSLYNAGRTLGWREYLLAGLFGSEDRIRRIVGLLTGQGGVGIVYPQTYHDVPYQAHTWLANREAGASWCHRLGISPVPQGYFDFPVGSMFWARGEALAPLFEAGIATEDFAAEAGQTDGTLAHCLERLLGLVPRHCGFRHAILRDNEVPGWSRWRVDSVFSRSDEAMFAMLADPRFRLVVFDIFDTLLLRPLIDPEHVKVAVARRIGGETGDAYLRERAEVESQARARAGRDVDLDTIYGHWRERGTLTAAELDSLRVAEEACELASVTARADAAALLGRLAAAGKTVVLASDTFLPQPLIERMLADHGVTGWQRLYCSSSVGLRKDSGALYGHILAAEGVPPAEAVMVGDSERSDFQIPADIGMAYCHVLRPTEAARCLPRWQDLIEDSAAWSDLDHSAGLGLVVRRRLAPLYQPDFSPRALLPDARAVGQAVVGPLVLAFVQWLARTAAADGIERLYFLAREGAILHRAYTRWRQATGLGPAADYLVLSRRSITVPMLDSLDDLREIARARFYPNDLAMFLRERFGLELTEAQETELEAAGIWKRGRPVEVRDRNIETLEPLLAHIHSWVREQAAAERPPLMAYLREMGLADGRPAAVVDVGYSATIQGRLNRLLQAPIHGYYFITNHDAGRIAAECGVRASGCFGHDLPAGDRNLGLYRQSFELEKLLSSDERQVLRYHLGADGQAVPEFRPECQVLAGAERTRAELQSGMVEFLDDAVGLQAGLLPDFTFPVGLAARLFDALVDDMAPGEEVVFRAIALDDYYCGRGIVS